MAPSTRARRWCCSPAAQRGWSWRRRSACWPSSKRRPETERQGRGKTAATAPQGAGGSLAAMSPTTSLQTTILRPGDDDYAAGCAVFNAALDLNPAAIAIPADADEVGAAVRQAADEGLNVAIVSGGHNPGPLGDLSETMLLRTERLADVSID